MTSREEHDERLQVDHDVTIYLREDDPQNRRDVESYIFNFIKAEKGIMTRRVAEWGVSVDRFVDVLTKKSEGNFMYLVYVLPDIREGKLASSSIDDIQKLPKGLRSYYQRHWRVMRAEDQERFEKYYENVLCQLAVAREPVTLHQLAEWTHLRGPRITEVIHSWRQFLNEETNSEKERVYRLYYASFQDFLREEVGLQRFHNRVVETALKKIPGFQMKM